MSSHQKRHQYPLLPLRRLVLFPGVALDVFFARETSVQLLKAIEKDPKSLREVLLLTQKEDDGVLKDADDFYPYGVIAEIGRVQEQQGNFKAHLVGVSRVRLESLNKQGELFVGSVEHLSAKEETTKAQARLRQTAWLLRDRFAKLNELLELIGDEKQGDFFHLDPPSAFVDRVACITPFEVEKKIALLGELYESRRAKRTLFLVEQEVMSYQEVHNLHSKTKERIEKSQHQYFLQEQMRLLQSQMDTEEGGEGSDYERVKKRIRVCKAPKETLEKLQTEAERLQKIPMASPEYAVILGYVENVLDMPWSRRSRLNHDLSKARAILDEDHYGLDNIKDLLLENLAVQKLSGKIARSIFCFVGPPGVGKTSIAASLARASGRVYRRIALGGVHDESELRGHRKTYIGAMPGRIVQNLKGAKVKNPLILFDEIDKLGRDFRGDPAAALLEILDPEQNRYFKDNYLEVDFDLSETMFVCTANSLEGIPEPLRDRMEIVQLPGYLNEEKYQILKRHLLPKQLKFSGLRTEEVRIDKPLALRIIEDYTHEAGVRSLERLLVKICRKMARKVVEDNLKRPLKTRLKTADLPAYLGVPLSDHTARARYLAPSIGAVNALAWTGAGGVLLRIEVISSASAEKGEGRLQTTGRLGEVMKESTQTVWSVVRHYLSQVCKESYDKTRAMNWHLHALDGATPKDGPSAGCAMATALFSAMMEIPVKGSVAMTGEISLGGYVMPIGGLREKAHAAVQTGVKTLLFPKANLADWEDLPAHLRDKIKGVACEHITEIWQIALETEKNFRKLHEKPL